MHDNNSRMGRNKLLALGAYTTVLLMAKGWVLYVILNQTF